MVPRRSRRSVLRAAVSALALGGASVASGCLSGEDAPADSTTSPPSTPTETATTTRPATSATGDASVVEYDDLDPSAQAVFDRLLETGSVTGLTDADSQAMRPLVVNEYVRYEGERYEVVGKRELIERTVLMGVEPSDDTPGESRVVAYEDLSDAGREAFDAVRTGDEDRVSFHPGDYPFPEDGYVRYDGTVYSLSVAHSTVETFSFRLSR